MSDLHNMREAAKMSPDYDKLSVWYKLKGRGATPKRSRVSLVKNPDGERVEVVGVYAENCPDGYDTLEGVLGIEPPPISDEKTEQDEQEEANEIEAERLVEERAEVERIAAENQVKSDELAEQQAEFARIKAEEAEETPDDNSD